jgi:opacity protein-like surface antigen
MPGSAPGARRQYGGTKLRHAIFSVIVLTLSTAPAVAQGWEAPVNVTAFAGAAMTPDPQVATGIAVGLKPRPIPVTLEFEYSRSGSDPAAGVPAIGTFSANILLQFPVQASRHQWYGTFGVGVYGLSLDGEVSEPEGVWNVGGGAKIAIAGPLKLRVDYRAFRLAPIAGEYHSHVHRLYMGILAGF